MLNLATMQEEAEDKKNELLAAFNVVSTFKNEEDDATFWNRLISDEQRVAATKAEEKKKAKPGSGTGEEAGASGAGPSGRTARRGDGPGGKGAHSEFPLVNVMHFRIG